MTVLEPPFHEKIECCMLFPWPGRTVRMLSKEIVGMFLGWGGPSYSLTA